MPTACMKAYTITGPQKVKPRRFSALVARHDRRVEAVEGVADALALAENGDPGEARLHAVEHQLLPQGAGVVLGHAPFVVVVGDVERIGPAPGAAVKRVGHGRRVRREEGRGKGD